MRSPYRRGGLVSSAVTRSSMALMRSLRSTSVLSSRCEVAAREAFEAAQNFRLYVAHGLHQPLFDLNQILARYVTIRPWLFGHMFFATAYYYAILRPVRIRKATAGNRHESDRDASRRECRWNLPPAPAKRTSAHPADWCPTAHVRAPPSPRRYRHPRC